MDTTRTPRHKEESEKEPTSSVSSCLGSSKPLPPGWRWVKLGEVILEAQPGFACGKRDPQGVVQLRMNNVDTWGNLIWDEVLRVPADPATVERFVLMPGDVVFNNTNSTELVGKSALFTGYSEPVVYSNHFTRLRTQPEALFPEFLAAWLSHQWQRGVFAAICNRWIGQSAIKTDKLFQLEIPLPPLSEQRRIAGILKEQMAAVERARAAARARLEAVKALPAAFLRQFFPQPAQPLPPGWRWVKLGEVADVVNGFGFSEVYQGRRDLPYPFIKVSDMNSPGAEVVINEAANTVDEAILSALGARCYPAGTIVFPKVGGALLTNKRRILGREASFDNNIMGVVPRNADGEFVFFWFSSVDLAAHANTQALPSIRQSLVASLEIPLPPLPEQRRIAGILKEQMAAVERARAAAEAELEAIEALPAALLRRAFSGEI